MPIDSDEAYSVGLAAAYRVIERWRPEWRMLSTFLVPYVRGAILDEARRMDWVPRLTRSKSRRMQAELDRVQARLHRTVTEHDLASIWGCTAEDAARRRREATPIGLASLQAAQFENDSGAEKTLEHSLIDKRAAPCKLERLDLLRLVAKGLKKIPRLALILYFFEGRTMAEIGRELVLSKSRVSQLLSAIVADLRVRLASRAEELATLFGG